MYRVDVKEIYLEKNRVSVSIYATKSHDIDGGIFQTILKKYDCYGAVHKLHGMF